MSHIQSVGAHGTTVLPVNLAAVALVSQVGKTSSDFEQTGDLQVVSEEKRNLSC